MSPSAPFVLVTHGLGSINHMHRLQGATPIDIPAHTHTYTPPLDYHPAYRVHRLLDVCHRGRGFKYLVDWAGYMVQRNGAEFHIP